MNIAVLTLCGLVTNKNVSEKPAVSIFKVEERFNYWSLLCPFTWKGYGAQLENFLL
jgi:hypothetical protein